MSFWIGDPGDHPILWFDPSDGRQQCGPKRNTDRRNRHPVREVRSSRSLASYFGN